MPPVSSHDSSSFHRRRVLRAFRVRGLTLRTTACDAVLNVLRREPESDRARVLSDLADECRRRCTASEGNNGSTTNYVVDESVAASVVADRTRDGDDASDEAVQLLNAEDTPRLEYDAVRRRFASERDASKFRRFGAAEDKVDMFARRLALVRQRVLRQECFRPRIASAGASGGGDRTNGNNTTTTTLTPVESLLGRGGGSRNLLGMLVQVEEGRYYLEDDTGQVPLDLSNASVLSDGLLCENSIVLLEGALRPDDGALVVHRIGGPPPETRAASFRALGARVADLFGALPSEAEAARVAERELERGEDTRFVVVSDLRLDARPRTLARWETLLRGLDAAIDDDDDDDAWPVFVLLGDFVSGVGGGHRDAVRAFDALAEATHRAAPRACARARFVLVPGPRDPGAAPDVFPRPPLPEYFVGGLRKRLPKLALASNPCRLRLYTRELVICRDDTSGRLRRCAVVPPRRREDDDDNDHEHDERSSLVDHVVQTVLDQGHLRPTPLAAGPIVWNLDHALRLYPLPDALLLGDDGTDQFHRVGVGGCDVVNAGSFAEDGSFVVYAPVCREEEDDDEENVTMRSKVEFSQVEL